METNENITAGNGLYDMLVEARQAMTFAQNDEAIALPDVNEEWQRLCRSQRPTTRLHWKTAAAAAAMVMMGGLAVAGLRSFSATEDEVSGAQRYETAPAAKTIQATPSAHSHAPSATSPILFHNAELQEIMQYVTDNYEVEVSFRNEAARHLRFYLQWETGNTVDDIVEKLNHFEKVHIVRENGHIIIE